MSARWRTWLGVVLAAALGAVAGCADRPSTGTDLGTDSASDSGPGLDLAGDGGGGGDVIEVACTGLSESACEGTDGCYWNVCPGCCDNPGFASCLDEGTAVDCAACGPIACKTDCETRGAADCESSAPCVAATCDDCMGGESFVACYDPAVGGPPFACAPCPGDCADLDEQGCLDATSCRADYCYDCSGGDNYQGCAELTAPPAACPPLACPADPCGGLDETACSASDVCHPVFADMMTCDCNEPGCCVLFASCGAGGRASCRGVALCDGPTPVCNESGTPEEFVVGYAGTCYEGCVRLEDCRQAP